MIVTRRGKLNFRILGPRRSPSFRLDGVLVQTKLFFDRDEILQSLWSGYQSQAQADPENKILSVWIKTKTQEALRNVEVASERDSQVLMTLGERYGMDFLAEEYEIISVSQTGS